ncbi:MAG: hypothetical protein M1818_007411 [Claussenomyces sp. TS43310]|nr:MAG: hypothetical protein M1818_007411 [Claussenomyces sp. TS43310]
MAEATGTGPVHADVVADTPTDDTVEPSTYQIPGLPSSAPSTSRLVSLAQTIARQTEIVDGYLRDHGGAYPSFEADGPLQFPSLPRKVQQARQAALEATTELKDLITGPAEMVRWMSWDFQNQTSLSAMNHFKIANSFPVGSTATFAEISKKVNLDEMNVRRLMRHAMTNRIFKEVSPGVVAHTAASRVLAEDAVMQDWVGTCTEDFYPASAQVVKALALAPGSQDMTQTGFQLANNTWEQEPLFVTLGKDPVRARRFGGSMHSLSNGEGYEPSYLVDHYPWADLDARQALVVDLGGSHGFVCKLLAERFPRLRFLVQDLPKMIVSAPSFAGTDLEGRIEFMAHDFMTEQPVKGADVYFFRWIFHNQPDRHALNIIQQLIPALKPGARILINDHCLPEVGHESLWDEKIIRSMDLMMLTLLNAQERSAAEFETLFRRADARFRFVGVTRPKGCRMSIVEAVWEGDGPGE